MKDNEKLEKIKEIILDECKKMGIGVERIILFGSRARGENKENSDFDIYVVVDDIEFFAYKKLYSKLLWRFAELDLNVDIIIRPFKAFEKNKNFLGFISHYANKEGISIWKRQRSG